MKDLKLVRLDTVARGAAPEVFAHEFAKILENVRDPNTDPKAKRTLTMTFTVVPTESRQEAEVRLKARVKLAPLTDVASFMFIQERNGDLQATTHDVQQGDLLAQVAAAAAQAEEAEGAEARE